MWRQLLLALSLVMELGLTIVLSAGLGWWAGLWLDARFGYNGVVSIVGLIIGVASGFVVAYRLLQRVLAGGGFGDG
jgi:hypothetical protein